MHVLMTSHSERAPRQRTRAGGQRRNYLLLETGAAGKERVCTPGSPTKFVDFRGFDSNIILLIRGGILMSMGKFPVKFDSSNVSRRNASRRIGRTVPPSGQSQRAACRAELGKAELMFMCYYYS